jgi:hypothetical protein
MSNFIAASYLERSIDQDERRAAEHHRSGIYFF